MAFGPCLLTTAADYRATGGHAAVRAEVVEDVHLARRYRAQGLPVTCLGGGDVVGFRMYPAGLRQLVQGWTKNIASGAGLSPPWALLGTVAWICACVAVALAGARGIAAWAFGERRPSRWPRPWPGPSWRSSCGGCSAASARGGGGRPLLFPVPLAGLPGPVLPIAGDHARRRRGDLAVAPAAVGARSGR